MLITFEGIDGCGKSTQIHKLNAHLSAQGNKVKVFREPGGTSLSEAIRSLLLDTRYDPEPVTELLLFSSARSQLIVQEVQPALEAGDTVILDRFFDSTTAYQGYGREVLSIDDLTAINQIASHGLVPDVTFYLRISIEEAIRRTESMEKDRMESGGRTLFQKVINGYESIAREQDRVIAIDAEKSENEVHRDILAAITDIS